VLDAIATALQLDDAERQHLRTLGAAIDQRAATKRPATERVAPALTELLTALVDVPAVVLVAAATCFAWNDLGHALLRAHRHFGRGAVNRRPNMAELVFLANTVAICTSTAWRRNAPLSAIYDWLAANTPTILRSLHSSAG